MRSIYLHLILNESKVFSDYFCRYLIDDPTIAEKVARSCLYDLSEASDQHQWEAGSKQAFSSLASKQIHSPVSGERGEQLMMLASSVIKTVSVWHASRLTVCNKHRKQAAAFVADEHHPNAQSHHQSLRITRWSGLWTIRSCLSMTSWATTLSLSTRSVCSQAHIVVRHSKESNHFLYTTSKISS